MVKKIDEHLDATGLKCPLPVLRARKRLKSLEIGERLMITATDPAAWNDFEVFCRETGHRLVDRTREEGGVIAVTIERG